MTADAKIGLLLGLVFIFVIAFVINGLPNFGGRAQVAEGTMTEELQDDRIGVADSARTAQERLVWSDLLEREGDETDGFEPLGGDLEPAVVPEPEVVVATELVGDVRTVYDLPSIDSLMDRISGGFSELTTAAGTVLASEQVAVTTPTATLAPVQIQPETFSDVIASSEQAPGLKPVRSQSQAAREVSNLIRKTAPKVYVVQAGDVLAAVAKKAYGSEEGNRLVNVKRIFEANRKVLNTPDEIFVGQKLVIPPLPQTTKKNDALSKALFEKVEAIGKRNLPQTTGPKPAGRSYVIKDDDSLWQIAATHLGSGARWKEIAKLNGLEGNETLKIGKELRLPTK